MNLRIGSEKLLSLGWSLPDVLKNEKPDVIVAAGFSLPTIFAYRYAAKHDIPFIIYSGETRLQSWRQLEWLRKSVRQYLFLRSSARIVYGEEARQFLPENDVNSKNVFATITTPSVK